MVSQVPFLSVRAALLVAGLLTLAPQAQAVQGVARALPYPEAVAVARGAARAVLGRAGDEACLRGKLSNAMLTVSSSCAAAGTGGDLCELAETLAVRLDPLSFPAMTATAETILSLTATAATDD